MNQSIIIRNEKISDIDKIWEINADVFKMDAEANLVNELRDSGCDFISLVAETGNEVVGHILFTPVELSGNPDLRIMGLAPMAVDDQYRKKGIGSGLIKAGLESCKSLNFGAVVVLGHPDYYPKFGFEPSVNFDIKSEYDVPDEVFMLTELVPGYLKNNTGIIKYHEAFANV